MRLSILTILLPAVPYVLGVASVLSTPSSSHPELEQRPLFRPPSDTVTVITESRSLVSEDTYDRLERFAKYSSAAYQILCPHPLGNTLVQAVSTSLRAFLPHTPTPFVMARVFAASLSAALFSFFLNHLRHSLFEMEF